jgi:hypothetical protein
MSFLEMQVGFKHDKDYCIGGGGGRGAGGGLR